MVLLRVFYCDFVLGEQTHLGSCFLCDETMATCLIALLELSVIYLSLVGGSPGWVLLPRYRRVDWESGQ